MPVNDLDPSGGWPDWLNNILGGGGAGASLGGASSPSQTPAFLGGAPAGNPPGAVPPSPAGLPFGVQIGAPQWSNILPASFWHDLAAGRGYLSSLFGQGGGTPQGPANLAPGVYPLHMAPPGPGAPMTAQPGAGGIGGDWRYPVNYPMPPSRPPGPAYDPLSSISTGRPYGAAGYAMPGAPGYGAAGYAMPPYTPGSATSPGRPAPTPPLPPVRPPGLGIPASATAQAPAAPNLGYYRPATGVARGAPTWTPYANAADPRLYRGPLSMFGGS